MFQYVFSFAVSVIASALATWCVRGVARRYRLAMPSPASRHIHTTPTPRLGGVAVFLTFSTIYGLCLLAGSHQWAANLTSPVVSRIALISIAFFAVGLCDDLKTLSAWTKLAVQIGGATALYFSGIHFGLCTSHVFSAGTSRFLCWLVTTFWVVLICNAINLIDGLDGLAAGAALFSMVTIFSLAFASRPGVAFSTTVLAGSVVGFLIFNFNPASIFLGDGGSLFVGFMLSGLVLAEAQQQKSGLDSVFVPLIAFALPLTDVAVSVVRRFLSGHSLFGADREHIHHKLLELGLTQRQVVWILYAFSASCALLSLVLVRGTDSALFPVIGVLLLAVFFGMRKLDYHEFTEFHRLWRRVAQQRTVFARNIGVRKAAARLETTHDPRTLLKILESCLREDFDGFEITVSDALASESSFVAPWRHGAVKHFWKESLEEVVFKLELTTHDGSPVGTLRLHQNAGSDLLIDTDLIKGHLRDAVSIALCNVAKTPRLAPIPLPDLRSAVVQAPAYLSDKDAHLKSPLI
jgi:UDP-GlcNAc:undecaprenyl-phosphate GlcNAc-1-phosphate transferase